MAFHLLELVAPLVPLQLSKSLRPLSSMELHGAVQIRGFEAAITSPSLDNHIHISTPLPPKLCITQSYASYDPTRQSNNVQSCIIALRIITYDAEPPHLCIALTLQYISYGAGNVLMDINFMLISPSWLISYELAATVFSMSNTEDVAPRHPSA
jgi:hypothetical protein